MGSYLSPDGWTVKASSTLRRDVVLNGPKHVLDDTEHCWNSDQGTPQWLQLDFGKLVDIQAVAITFQGGFVGLDCRVLVGSGEKAPASQVAAFEPDDVNKPQTFTVDADRAKAVAKMRLVFGKSTDSFGRIVIYSVKVQGSETSAAAAANTASAGASAGAGAGAE